MRIDLLAIETSGLDPKMDEILEWCVASYDSDTGKISGDSGVCHPKHATLGDEVVKIHTKSGLFEAMGAQEPRPLPPPSVCNGRVVWAAPFALGFLPQASAWQHCVNGTELIRIARWAGKAPDWDPKSRAEDKVRFMAEALARLVGR